MKSNNLLVGIRNTSRRAWRLVTRQRLRDRFPMPAIVAREISRIERESIRDPGGYCPKDKQRVLASLITKNGLTKSVEIGVYRGSSLLPQAVAQRYTGGLAIGIDPYSTAAAQQFDNLERIHETLGDDFQVDDVDFECVYRETNERIQQYGLTSHCKLIRQRSSDAADLIEPGVDLIHIDGNHDADAVANDIRLYLPKIKSGGYLVLDDTNWDTIQPEYKRLRSTLKLVYGDIDEDGHPPPWAVFQVP